jgi:alkyl hydroperoxide reductase subunit AhpC
VPTLNTTLLILFLWIVDCISMDSLKVGQQAPTFALKAITGKTVFLRDYCGDLRSDKGESHVVVLSFFATWCVPCQHEIPILDKFYQDFSYEKIKVILVAVGEDQQKVITYAKAKNISLNIVLDNFLTTSKNYGVVNHQGSMTLPQLFIIDHKGFISFIQKGYRDDIDLRKMLIQKVGELLN